MTSMSMTPPPPPPHAVPSMALDVSGTAPVPFSRLARVEFRKSYDTRAGRWLLITIGIIVGIVEVVVLIMQLVHPSLIYFTDFAMIAGGITSLLLPVLGIMLVTSEWSQRSAMVSFALEPRRIRIVMAKWLVAVIWVFVTLVAMFVIAVVMTSISAAAQPDYTHWSGYSSGTPHIAQFALVQVLTMTIGFAFAALLLNTPAAIVLFFIYWYALPGVLGAIGTISDGLGNALDWINFQSAIGPFVDGTISTGEEWGKIFVSAVLWIGLPLLAGIWRIMRAEVK
jgi:ABC-type transport system involved in multi-copper enzyme maturation permease subunit